MKTAYRLANIGRVTEPGSPEAAELLEALVKAEGGMPVRVYDGMTILARRKDRDDSDFRTYQVRAYVFQDDSMLLRYEHEDVPPFGESIDLDDLDDALRAATVLVDTKLGPSMLSIYERALMLAEE